MKKMSYELDGMLCCFQCSYKTANLLSKIGALLILIHTDRNVKILQASQNKQNNMYGYKKTND